MHVTSPVADPEQMRPLLTDNVDVRKLNNTSIDALLALPHNDFGRKFLKHWDLALSREPNAR